MFQDFLSLTDTKSLHFHSPFSHLALLFLCIHVPTSLHIILSQIQLYKERCHLPSTLQQQLLRFNIVVPSNPNSYELTLTKKGGLHFLLSEGSLCY